MCSKWQVCFNLGDSYEGQNRNSLNTESFPCISLCGHGCEVKYHLLQTVTRSALQVLQTRLRDSQFQGTWKRKRNKIPQRISFDSESVQLWAARARIVWQKYYIDPYLKYGEMCASLTADQALLILDAPWATYYQLHNRLLLCKESTGTVAYYFSTLC